MRRIVIVLTLALAGLLAVAASASASQILARDARHPHLKVTAGGIAVFTYADAAGAIHHTLAWHAINAHTPDPEVSQVRFKVNYSDGWGTTLGAGFSKRAVNACTPYTGPPLTHVIVGCDAPDGSYWVLQKWRRALPDGGWTPTAAQDEPEFQLSHWSGDLPQLEVDTDWIYNGRFDHIFGYLHYRDEGVYGFSSTSVGNPLDSYGRNLYVDVHDPAWGEGWYRFNSGLLHRPTGAFCMGMYPEYNRTQPAAGDEYRATVMGPGVTPILSWTGPAPGPYSKSVDKQKNAEQQSFTVPGDSCYDTH